jgi:hypothetical protein
MDLGAIDVGTADTASLIGLGVLALIALAVLLLVGKLFAKLVIVAVIVVLGVAVWNQRAELADCPRTCSCSFFGYQLEIAQPTVDGLCQDVVSRIRAAID